MVEFPHSGLSVFWMIIPNGRRQSKKVDLIPMVAGIIQLPDSSIKISHDRAGRWIDRIVFSRMEPVIC